MSKAIYDPALSGVEEHSASSATIVIEPLHSGYGNTIGNSFRRVLLSSIRGGAIVALRVDGANHEFTTLPGVREDIVDIILNLKGVRLIVHVDEPVELRIEKKGAGPITAADIKTNADVEVVNPEHVIANIDDSKASFSADIVVESGRGYRTIEESSEDRLHSNMIAIDAIFSPVQRVRFKVDSTRVGQETNLDRLALTIDTDGSLTPKEAFEEAAAILVSQYSSLAGGTKVVGAITPGQSVEGGGSQLETLIEDLNLSARTTNALINNEIRSVHDLITLSEQGLRELKGFGSKAFDEVREKLAELEF